jgi:hypothetical protein
MGVICLAVGVFLSHSSADKPFARRLGSDLRRSGARVWIDEAEIRVGDSLIEKISAGIVNTDYLIVALSRASCDSEWVRREVNIALTQEIHGKRVKVLPCLLEDCDIPPFLLDKKYADFRASNDYRTARTELIEALGLDGTGPQERFLDQFIFYDLANVNDGFDVPIIRYFSADDFAIALARIEVFGVGVFGIEPWLNGGFYDVKTFEEYGDNPFDSKWYKRAYGDFLKEGVNLHFAASYEVPQGLLKLFMRGTT